MRRKEVSVHLQDYGASVSTVSRRRATAARVPENSWEAHMSAAWAMLHGEPEHEDRVETLLLRALAIQEQALGPEHPSVAVTLANLMFLYRRQGKEPEAAAVAARAVTILATHGRESPLMG
jgi:hypothetical protein